MPAGLRVLTLAGGLIGGCSGISLLLGQLKRSNSNISAIPSSVSEFRPAPITRVIELVPVAKSSQNIVPQESKIGNCISIELSEALESMLWGLGMGKDSYTAISCENANEDEGSKLPNNWTGLFPETLFKRHTSTEKEKFEIKTKTQQFKTETNKYNISFSGNGFNNTPVNGEWDETTQNVESYSVISIEVTSQKIPENKKIYLAAK